MEMTNQDLGRPASTICEGKLLPLTSDPEGARLAKPQHLAVERLECITILDHRAPMLTGFNDPLTFKVTLCPTCINTLVFHSPIKYQLPSQSPAETTDLVSSESLERPSGTSEITSPIDGVPPILPSNIPKEALVSLLPLNLKRDKLGVEYGHPCRTEETERFYGRSVKLRLSGTFLRFLTSQSSGHSPEGYLFSGLVVGQSLNTEVVELEVMIIHLNRVVCINPSAPATSDDLLSLDLSVYPSGMDFTEGLDDSGALWSSTVTSHFGAVQLSQHVQDLEAAAELSYPVFDQSPSNRGAADGIANTLNAAHSSNAHTIRNQNAYSTPQRNSPTSPVARVRIGTTQGQSSLSIGRYPSYSAATPSDYYGNTALNDAMGVLNAQVGHHSNPHLNLAGGNFRGLVTHGMAPGGYTPVTCPFCSGHHSYPNWQVTECRQRNTGLNCPSCNSRIDICPLSTASGYQNPGLNPYAPHIQSLGTATGLISLGAPAYPHAVQGQGQGVYASIHQTQNPQVSVPTLHQGGGPPLTQPAPNEPPLGSSGGGSHPPFDPNNVMGWVDLVRRGITALETNATQVTLNTSQVGAQHLELRSLGAAISNQTQVMCSSLELVAEKMNASKDGLLQPKARDWILIHFREAGRHGDITGTVPISQSAVGLLREDLIRFLHGMACSGTVDFKITSSMAYNFSLFDFGEAQGAVSELLFEDWRSVPLVDRYKSTEVSFPITLTKGNVKRTSARPVPVKDKSDLVDIGMNLAKFLGELLGEVFYTFTVFWLECLIKMIEKDMVTNSWTDPPRISGFVNTVLKAWCRRAAEWSSIITNGGYGDFFFTPLERDLARKLAMEPIPFMCFCEVSDPVFRVNHLVFHERVRNVWIDKMVALEAQREKQRATVQADNTRVKGAKGGGVKGKGKRRRVGGEESSQTPYQAPESWNLSDPYGQGQDADYSSSHIYEYPPVGGLYDAQAIQYNPYTDASWSNNTWDSSYYAQTPYGWQNVGSSDWLADGEDGSWTNWTGTVSQEPYQELGSWSNYQGEPYQEVGSWEAQQVVHEGYFPAEQEAVPEDDEAGLPDLTLIPEAETCQVGAVLDAVDVNPNPSTFQPRPSFGNAKGSKGKKGKADGASKGKGKPKGKGKSRNSEADPSYSNPGFNQGLRKGFTELTWPTQQYKSMCEGAGPVDINGKKVCIAFNSHAGCSLVGLGKQCIFSHLQAVGEFNLESHIAAVQHGGLLWYRPILALVTVRELIQKALIQEWEYQKKRKSGSVGRVYQRPSVILTPEVCAPLVHSVLGISPCGLEVIDLKGSSGSFNLSLQLVDYGSVMNDIEDSCFFIGISAALGLNPGALATEILRQAMILGTSHGSIGSHALAIAEQSQVRLDTGKGKIQVDTVRLFAPEEMSATALVIIFEDDDGQLSLPLYQVWSSDPRTVAFLYVKRSHLRWARPKVNGSFCTQMGYPEWRQLANLALSDGLRSYTVWCQLGSRLSSTYDVVGSTNTTPPNFKWFYDQHDLDKQMRSEIVISVGSKYTRPPKSNLPEGWVLTPPCLIENSTTTCPEEVSIILLEAARTMLYKFFGAVSPLTAVHPIQVYRAILERPKFYEHRVSYDLFLLGLQRCSFIHVTLGPHFVAYAIRVGHAASSYDYHKTYTEGSESLKAHLRMELYDTVSSCIHEYLDLFKERFGFLPRGFPYGHDRYVELGYGELPSLPLPDPPCFASIPADLSFKAKSKPVWDGSLCTICCKAFTDLNSEPLDCCGRLAHDSCICLRGPCKACSSTRCTNPMWKHSTIEIFSHADTCAALLSNLSGIHCHRDWRIFISRDRRVAVTDPDFISCCYPHTRKGLKCLSLVCRQMAFMVQMRIREYFNDTVRFESKSWELNLQHRQQEPDCIDSSSISKFQQGEYYIQGFTHMEKAYLIRLFDQEKSFTSYNIEKCVYSEALSIVLHLLAVASDAQLDQLKKQISSALGNGNNVGGDTESSESKSLQRLDQWLAEITEQLSAETIGSSEYQWALWHEQHNHQPVSSTFLDSFTQFPAPNLSVASPLSSHPGPGPDLESITADTIVDFRRYMSLKAQECESPHNIKRQSPCTYTVYHDDTCKTSWQNDHDSGYAVPSNFPEGFQNEIMTSMKVIGLLNLFETKVFRLASVQTNQAFIDFATFRGQIFSNWISSFCDSASWKLYRDGDHILFDAQIRVWSVSSNRRLTSLENSTSVEVANTSTKASFLPHMDTSVGGKPDTPPSSVGAHTEASVIPVFSNSDFNDLFTDLRCYGRGTRWNFVVTQILESETSTHSDVIADQLCALELVATDMAMTFSHILEDRVESDRSLQHEYLNHVDTWARHCLKAAHILNSDRHWLQFLVASWRDLNVSGECVPAQDWKLITETFKSVLSAEHFDYLRKVVIDGFSVDRITPRTRLRGRCHKSMSDRKREMFGVIWQDANNGMLLIFGPKSLDLMNIAEIACCAYGRVEKHSTATGLPKGSGRLIHDLTFSPWVGEIHRLGLNSLISSENDAYERYYLPRHLEYIVMAYYLDQFRGGFQLQVNKDDVKGAFRNVGQCLMNIGDIAGEIEGHTAIEVRGCFGFKKMPVIYHSSGTIPIHRKHNSRWAILPPGGFAALYLCDKDTILETTTLEDAVNMNILHSIIPLRSATFVDDTGKVMIKCQALINTCDSVCAEVIRARFGPDSLSMKDPDEMKAEDQQTITGIILNFAERWMQPSFARVQKGVRYIHLKLPKVKLRQISARDIFEVYCLWQWIAAAERRLRPFVHTLKRCLEGVSSATHPDELVTPSKPGDSDALVEESWNELESALETLDLLSSEFLSGKAQWNCSFWQALPVYQRLTSPGSELWLQAIQKDSSVGGMGAINFTRKEFFYIMVPMECIREMEETFEHGFRGNRNLFSIGLCELACRVFCQLVWGSASPLPSVKLNTPHHLDTQTPVQWPTSLWIMEDNVGMEVAGERGHTTTARGQRMLRIETIDELDNQTQKVTSRVASEENHSDMPSRLYNKEGLWDKKVCSEFIEWVESNNLNLTEVLVPPLWVTSIMFDDRSRDLVLERDNARLTKSGSSPSTIDWAESKHRMLCKSDGQDSLTSPRNLHPKLQRSVGSFQFRHENTTNRLRFLIPHASTGLLDMQVYPSLTALCYGSLNSTHGWIAEDFKLTQRAEIAKWSISEANRLYPDSVELNDLNNVSTRDIIATDALQMGLPCQFISSLGEVKAGKHSTGHLFLALIRLVLTVGFKVITIEEVVGILTYADGFYYKGAVDLIHAAGFEFSSRIVNAWDHGLPQARFRVIMIITNPRYGPHSLLGKLENMRRSGDPTCVEDIAVDHPYSNDVEYFELSQVHWLKSPSAFLGRATVLGSIGRGGPGWKGSPDRTVRDGSGPASPVPTTLNNGVYLFKDSVIRSLNVEECLLCQGLMTEEAARLLSYPGPSIKLPDNLTDIGTAIGNGESGRQSQSVARSAKVFLNHSRDTPAGLLPNPRTEIDSVQNPVLSGTFWTSSELDSWEKWKLKKINPAHLPLRDDLLVIKLRSTSVGGDDDSRWVKPIPRNVTAQLDLSWNCPTCRVKFPSMVPMCLECRSCPDCCPSNCVISPGSAGSRPTPHRYTWDCLSPVEDSPKPVPFVHDTMEYLRNICTCEDCSNNTGRICLHCGKCFECCPSQDCSVCKLCGPSVANFCSSCWTTWCSVCTSHNCPADLSRIRPLKSLCLIPAMKGLARAFNQVVCSSKYTCNLAASCYLALDRRLFQPFKISDGNFDPALRQSRRRHGSRPAGLETPTPKLEDVISDHFVLKGGRIAQLLDLPQAETLVPFVNLCTHHSWALQPAKEEFFRLELAKLMATSLVNFDIRADIHLRFQRWNANARVGRRSSCSNPECSLPMHSNVAFCSHCNQCASCCINCLYCHFGEISRRVREWPHSLRTSYVKNRDRRSKAEQAVTLRNTQSTWLRCTELARTFPLTDLIDFARHNRVSSNDVGAFEGELNAFGEPIKRNGSTHSQSDHTGHGKGGQFGSHTARGPGASGVFQRAQHGKGGYPLNRGKGKVGWSDHPPIPPNKFEPYPSALDDYYARPEAQKDCQNIFRPGQEPALTQVQNKKGKRARIVVQKNDPVLIAFEAELAGSALEESTENKSYLPAWNMFKECCTDLEMSYNLTGANKKEDEETLCKYVAFEYGFHKNAYSTIRIKLYGIRWFTMEAGFPDPLEGKPRLKRIMKGLKKLRGAVNRKKPLSPRLLTNLVDAAKGKGLEAAAVSTAIQVAFFFLLRVSEFAAQDQKHVSKFIMRRCDVRFKRQGIEVSPFDIPDEVELYVRGSKTDSSLQGCYRSHFASGSHLCPVKALVVWCRMIDGLVKPLEPLFSIPRPTRAGGIPAVRTLTRDLVTKALKAFAPSDGLSAADVSTHSCRSGGATALLRAGVDPAVIQVIGRWSSDIFKIYTRYHNGIMSGVSSVMARLI